jgi:hypothetical protein
VGSQRTAPPVLDLFGPGMFGPAICGDDPAATGVEHRPDGRAPRDSEGHRRPGRRSPGRRSPLRGRHIRPAGYSRVPIAQAVAEVVSVEEHLVLHVLRRRPVDLDAVQVAALAALPPSVAVATLNELVRSGLARDVLVGNRLRFGLP